MVFASRVVSCPVVTPFADGSVDHDGLAGLVEALADRGVEAMVPCGTTGEFSSLTAREQRDVVETTVAAAPDDVPVVAGASATAARAVRDRIEAAAEVGADGALVLPPYFLSGDGAGVERFFERAVADSPLPVYLYNLPGVTGTEIAPETVAALANHEAIAGIKDTSGDMTYASKVIEATPEDFQVLGGFDAQLVPGIYLGMDGGINALSNLVPELIGEVIAAARRGDHDRARQLHHERVVPLFQACLDFGFAPAMKTLLAEQGVIESAEVRPPLSPPDADERAALVERANPLLSPDL